MAKHRTWTDRLSDWLDSGGIFRSALFLFGAGLLVLSTSFLLGIDSVRDPRSGREVGLAHSPYWIAVFLVFVPLATIGIALLLRTLRRLFSTRNRRSMLFDVEFAAPAENASELEGTWRSAIRGALPWLLLLGVVTIAVSAFEFRHEVHRPLFALGSAEELYHANVQEPARAVPLSWATAALASPPESVGRGLNLAFDVAALSLQLFAKLLAVLFLTLAATLAAWLLRHGLGLSRLRIVPDLTSSDPRLGFQRFELTARLIFGVTALSIPMLWLVIVQSLYLADFNGAESIWKLVFGYGDRPLAALFEVPGTLTSDVFWARLVGLASILLSWLLVVGVALPVVMRSARAFCLDRLDTEDPQAFERQFGSPPTEAREKLERMPVWPYRFLSPTELGIALVLGIASLWFFRLAPYAFLTLLVLFVLRTRTLFRNEAAARSGAPPLPRYVVPVAALLLAIAIVALGRSTQTQPESLDRGPVRLAPRIETTEYASNYDTSRALLIGIGYSGSEHFPALPNAQRDVDDLEEVLQRTGSKWEIHKLLGAEANHDAILDALGTLVRSAKRDDRVFIYFAGHAVKHRERSGWILPADARPAHVDPGRKRMIRFDEFTNFFWDSRAKHILIALDCCYSGRATRSVPSHAALDKYVTLKSHVIIASGRPNEPVSDGIAGQNSPFARAFLDALKTSGPAVPVSTLYGEIQKAFRDVPRQTPQIIYVQQEGQFLFLPPGR